MKKGLLFLIAFLGALGIGLFWFNGFVENRVDEARATGFAQCEVEYAKKEVCLINSKLESVKNENIKKAIIWARPNSRLSQLIERMREQGIGTINNHSENSHLSGSG